MDDETKMAIRLDRAYIAGANFGWNCGHWEAIEQFQESMKGMQREIHDALKDVEVQAIPHTGEK